MSVRHLKLVRHRDFVREPIIHITAAFGAAHRSTSLADSLPAVFAGRMLTFATWSHRRFLSSVFFVADRTLHGERRRFPTELDSEKLRKNEVNTTTFT